MPCIEPKPFLVAGQKTLQLKWLKMWWKTAKAKKPSVFTYQQVSNLLYGITSKDFAIHIIFIYPKLHDDLLGIKAQSEKQNQN